MLCVAGELAPSGEAKDIADDIDTLEDVVGRPPEDLQGFHDGLMAALRGSQSFAVSDGTR